METVAETLPFLRMPSGFAVLGPAAGWTSEMTSAVMVGSEE